MVLEFSCCKKLAQSLPEKLAEYEYMVLGNLKLFLWLGFQEDSFSPLMYAAVVGLYMLNKYGSSWFPFLS